MNPEIESLRDADGTLGPDAVMSVIPYAPPFLFVSRITHLEAEYVEGTYDISDAENLVSSHFTGFPVMPASLMTEGFGQTGTVLIRYNLANHQDREILIYRTEDARYKRPAFPGDTLTYCVHLKTMDKRAARLEGEIQKNGTAIASCRLVMTIQDRDAFRSTAGSS